MVLKQLKKPFKPMTQNQKQLKIRKQKPLKKLEKDPKKLLKERILKPQLLLKIVTLLPQKRKREDVNHLNNLNHQKEWSPKKQNLLNREENKRQQSLVQLNKLLAIVAIAIHLLLNNSQLQEPPQVVLVIKKRQQQ